MPSARYRGPESTLAQLREQHGWVWAWCGARCGHYAAVPLAPVVKRMGENKPVQSLRSRLTCTACSRRGATLTVPSWTGMETGWDSLPLDHVPAGLMRAMADDALAEIGVRR